jgi:DNA repair protein RadC
MNMKLFKSLLPELTIKYKTGMFRKAKIAKAGHAFEVLKQLFNEDTIEYSEEFLVLFLNKANNTIGWIRLSTGGIDGVTCDYRIIFGVALKSGASAMVLAHNHPSGNINPSEADIAITRKAVQIGNMHEIKVLDHIIVTSDDFFSMADNGLVQFNH